MIRPAVSADLSGIEAIYNAILDREEAGPVYTNWQRGKYPTTDTARQALEAGTLFPDLDLPFHLKVTPSQLADSHLNQLRALDFVILELGLYLDTHPYDAEAFALFQNYVELEKTARAAYVEQHGPLTMTDAALNGSYTWGDGPWPWQYPEEEG